MKLQLREIIYGINTRLDDEASYSFSQRVWVRSRDLTFKYLSVNSLDLNPSRQISLQLQAKMANKKFKLKESHVTEIHTEVILQ
jgi:hypothetical protein